MLVRCLLLALSSATAALARSPSVGFISPDVIAEIGQDVELTCVLRDLGDYSMLWQRLEQDSGKNFPIANANALFIREERYGVKSEKDG